MCGTVGENCALTGPEKAALMELAAGIARGRLPVIAGIAEYTAAFAIETARQAARAGVDGLMVLPPMVYPAKPRETLAHFRAVASAGDLPVMIYNNPPAYRSDVNAGDAGLPRRCRHHRRGEGVLGRHQALRRPAQPHRRALHPLLRPSTTLVLECAALGAVGWVSGMSNIFPREGEALFGLARAGRFAEAMALYDWFMPLPHLDARPDLVQCIKLCEAIAGRGERSAPAPPRLALDGAERAEIEVLMARALATRPVLPGLEPARAA